MAIKYITKEEINKEQWDRCMLSATPALPYGLYDYLELSTQGYFAGLVLNDYEAVMPIPIRGKQIKQPFISQQLGVFSANEIDPLPFYQRLATLSNSIQLKIFNPPSFNPGAEFEKQARTNFILDLHKPYEEIQKNYSKTLRKRLRRQKEQAHLVEEVALEKVIAAYKNNLENKVRVGEAKYAQATALFDYCLKQQMAKTYAMEDTQGNVLAIGIFIFFANRIINVFASSTALGMERQGMALLLDALFEKYAEKELLFDFEGSDIPGVKAFFQSFGPEEIPYLEIILEKRSLWQKVWDKLMR